jgi:hypothetical protein
METVLQDLRYAVRTLAAPAFNAIAIFIPPWSQHRPIQRVNATLCLIW